MMESICSSSRELLAKETLRALETDGEHSDISLAISVMPSPKPDSKYRKLLGILRSIFHSIPMPLVPCRWLNLPPGHCSLGRRVTGTLYGYKKAPVHFAVQECPRSQPVLHLELAIQTNTLVKDMASSLVRISLECERTPNRGELLLEPVWTMYCNGRSTGYAVKRQCSEEDLQVLNLIATISMGAGVLPMEDGMDGELLYMRARLERVVGSRDSEAFYMMNPDGNAGPEFCIFLLRI